MDSFELNKIAAAILIALPVIKGADLISNHLIEPRILKENVYKITGVSVSSSGAPVKMTKKGPAPVEPLLASANVQQGEIAFKKCTSCHTIEKGGPNRIGPDLYGIVGAPKGQH
ncbi:MAG: cytochrome c family protein, partial [Alphaproteobacteria bacterium]|nr:cytochrome c family protein [Alphaproteobacteria bacterium]